jgi:hypothetical protein
MTPQEMKSLIDDINYDISKVSSAYEGIPFETNLELWSDINYRISELIDDTISDFLTVFMLVQNEKSYSDDNQSVVIATSIWDTKIRLLGTIKADFVLGNFAIKLSQSFGNTSTHPYEPQASLDSEVTEEQLGEP